MDTIECLKWYSQEAARTKQFVPDAYNRFGGTSAFPEEGQHLFHAILGMAGEASEIMGVDGRKANYTENLNKEFGDWLWYAEMGAQALATSLAELEVEQKKLTADEVISIYVASGANVEIMKKWLFYGKRMEAKEILRNIVMGLAWIRMSCLDDNDFAEVLKMNIEKLRKRFPEKFTEADAIARVDA